MSKKANTPVETGLIQFALQYIAPYRTWFILALSASASLIALQVYSAVLIGDFVNLSIANRSPELIIKISLYFAVGLCCAAVAWLAKRATMTFSSLFVQAIKNALANQTVSLRAAEADEYKLGDMQTRMSTDAEALMRFMTGDFQSLIVQPIQSIVCIITICFINWKLCLVTFSYTPFAMLLAGWLNSKSAVCYPRRSAHVSESNTILSQVLEGWDIVRTFHLFHWFASKAAKANRRVYVEDQRINRYVSLLQPVCTSIANVPGILLVLFGGWLAMHRQVSPGDIVTSLQLLAFAVSPTVYLPFTLNNWSQAKASLQRIKAVMDLPVEQMHGWELSLPSFTSAVTFHQIMFAYKDDMDRPTLNHISFSVEPATKVAIVGPSGSGKSTILDLICGFYQPQEGRITIWGNDLTTVSPKTLRAQIAVVSQRVDLFSGTIADNIAWGKAGSTRSETVRAAQLADAHSFIEQMPDGYETWLTANGDNLSGGQRQRLAIARAFLKDAPLVLLDEPTSALDPETSQQIHAALRALSAGKTLIYVTHRLADACDADLIHVLEGGDIIQSGTHAELLDTCDIYRTIWARQEGQVNSNA